MDAVMKMLAAQPVLDTSVQLGYPDTPEFARGLGAVLLACTALHARRRSAFVGALLLTGYLGGAVATHVRVDNPLFSHVLFGVYVGIFVWGGLLLRDARVRGLLLGR